MTPPSASVEIEKLARDIADRYVMCDCDADSRIHGASHLRACAIHARQQCADEIVLALLSLAKSSAGLREALEQAKREVPLGRLPKTSDGVAFGMGANLWLRRNDGSGEAVGVGVLRIEDPDDQHWDDYPEGERWRILVRDTEGNEIWLPEGHAYSTEAAALSANSGGSNG